MYTMTKRDDILTYNDGDGPTQTNNGSTRHEGIEGWLWTSAGGWQPRPTMEPAPAVTFLPTVMVAGALWASKKAPGATLMLPETAMTAPAPTLQNPVIVMLE